MVEEKFSVLESIHQVVSEDGVSASLSIGIGKDCGAYEESFRWAEKAIETGWCPPPPAGRRAGRGGRRPAR